MTSRSGSRRVSRQRQAEPAARSAAGPARGGSFFGERGLLDFLATHVAPSLIAGASPQAPARIWVPVCGTGEEAYSVAILLLERFAAAGRPAALKIFATDADPLALDVARKGTYPACALLTLSSRRRQRFFVPSRDTHFQVSRTLREALVFGLHDLLRDPPISQLDLIVYRGALADGNSEDREKVLALLHFGLKPTGHALLSSDADAAATGLFDAASGRWPLYRRSGGVTEQVQRWMARRSQPRASGRTRAKVRPEPATVEALMDEQLLDEFAPAAIVVDARYQVLAARGAVAKYLKTPTSSLLAAAGASLRRATQAACEQAMRTNTQVRNIEAWVRRKGRYVRCRVSARSLRRASGGERLVLVAFAEAVAPGARRSHASRPGASAHHLKEQLRGARSELEAAAADLEWANRSLQALDEQARSADEELRSSNEELQSANEELLAANQELEISKASLQERTDEIERVQEQLHAVLDATADAVVTTDGADRIVTFNRSAARMFGYAIHEVIGRRIDLLLPPQAHRPRPGRADTGSERVLRNLIGAPQEVMARRRTGIGFPALLSIAQTTDGELLVCCLRDLSLDKALQREVLRIATLEQQRIGQELHDGLQQELTGLGLLAQNLADDLERSGSTDSARASRLAAGVSETNLKVRSLARGLVPVPVNADTLPAALAELAKRTQETCKVECRCECSELIRMPDAATATHLYRIAQEAVGNAVKHARSKHVRIRLMYKDGGLRLEVCDDGIGVPALPATHAGVGLRLMEHRCALIGGRFALERGLGSGTLVSCTIGARNVS